jgi:hypothetical protein
VTVAQVAAVMSVIRGVAFKFQTDRADVQAYVESPPPRRAAVLAEADQSLLRGIDQSVKAKGLSTTHLRLPKIAAILLALDDVARRRPT